MGTGKFSGLAVWVMVMSLEEVFGVSWGGFWWFCWRGGETRFDFLMRLLLLLLLSGGRMGDGVLGLDLSWERVFTTIFLG